MVTQEIKLLRMVYGKMCVAVTDIFPGFGPTDRGMVADLIVDKYDGTIGEWWLYSTDGRSAPEHLNFQPAYKVKAKSPTIFAKVLVWSGDPPNPLHVEDVEVIQTG